MLFRRVLDHVKEQNWTAVGIDFVIVVVGVFIGIQVANWNQARGERRLGEEYLQRFGQDLAADCEMLSSEIRGRESQLVNARTVLEFFEGRPLEVSTFFAAFYDVLQAFSTAPNRNTMDEVTSTGSLRLIPEGIRKDLLDLYTMYEDIAYGEEHLARDYDNYLYDTTFSIIPIQIAGPWEDNAGTRAAAERVINHQTIENGFRLVVVNLELADTGLVRDLKQAKSHVDKVMGAISPDLSCP